VKEVKGIYAGLVMVEKKCVEIDNQQVQNHAKVDDHQMKRCHEEWQALIALHRTLLHEHHDFFLASQHPSASPALRQLAAKYAMPARMWRHRIHSLLELLRHKLLDSLDHMLAFIYLAYSMMALLKESVPAFKDTWIECLGDLARYRMAIEDEDLRNREAWPGVARNWYNKAADKSPKIGRIQHHLAVLARPNALQQLFYYTRTLTCIQPFSNARESILTLFSPILEDHDAVIQGHRRPGILKGARGSSDCSPSNGIRLGCSKGPRNCSLEENCESPADSLSLISSTLRTVVQRIGDKNVLPHVHISLAFLFRVSLVPEVMRFVEPYSQWALLVALHTLGKPGVKYARVETDTFPLPENAYLPEDFAMRGQVWCQQYHPENFFGEDCPVDDEERFLEMPSMAVTRVERCLYLGIRLCAVKSIETKY
jgi:hypothetical protein